MAIPKHRIMLILQPILPNPNLMSMRIEEVGGIDENWKISILSKSYFKVFYCGF
jgi:hypothetical protein